MPRPSLGQLRWFALFFGIFFTVSSVAEYLFVNRLSRLKEWAEFADNATNISRSVEYNGGVDPALYYKAYADTTTNYMIVLRDGSILDAQMGTYALDVPLSYI
jgi:hypothetical protein